MKIRLHLWPTADEKAAKEFWSSVLEISPDNFTKSLLNQEVEGLENVCIQMEFTEYQFLQRNFWIK
jgi:hypothetical protein